MYVFISSIHQDEIGNFEAKLSHLAYQLFSRNCKNYVDILIQGWKEAHNILQELLLTYVENLLQKVFPFTSVRKTSPDTPSKFQLNSTKCLAKSGL